MNCKEVEEREILDGYLLNRLTEAEREEYERHFFECEVCLSKVQTGLALQEELQNASQGDFVATGSIRSWRWNWATTFAAVALGVMLVVGSLWLRRHQRAVSAIPAVPTLSRSHSQVPAAPSLGELARVTPPQYDSTILLRSTESQAQTEFSKAMKYYQKGDYEHSIPGLKRAVQMDPAAGKFSFYLGACYLLTNQTDAAMDSFQRTLSSGDTRYVDEAHFYLAKVYLKEGKIAEARNELLATSGYEHAIETEDILRQLPK